MAIETEEPSRQHGACVGTPAFSISPALVTLSANLLVRAASRLRDLRASWCGEGEAARPLASLREGPAEECLQADAGLEPSMSNETGSGEAGASGLLDVDPSMPMCIALSAFGGFLEVSSTMCLAYPEYRAKMGKEYSKCEQRLHMILNLSLMAIASVAYIVGSFYGPVALSVPTVMVSKLMFNLLIIGFVLRMDEFSKNQKVGTYCIACAILTLPSIGPSDQPDLVPSEAILEVPAIIWSAVLFGGAILCTIGMVVLQRRAVPPEEDYHARKRHLAVSMVVYVTAQVTSTPHERRQSAPGPNLNPNPTTGDVRRHRHECEQDVRQVGGCVPLLTLRVSHLLRRHQRRLSHLRSDRGEPGRPPAPTRAQPHPNAPQLSRAAPLALARPHLP